MLQKPVIFTSRYITEAYQLRGRPSSQSMGIGYFLARGKSERGVNLIFLPYIVPKLKVSEAIPQLFPHALMISTVTTLSWPLHSVSMKRCLKNLEVNDILQYYWYVVSLHSLTFNTVIALICALLAQDWNFHMTQVLQSDSDSYFVNLIQFYFSSFLAADMSKTRLFFL